MNYFADMRTKGVQVMKSFRVGLVFLLAMAMVGFAVAQVQKPAGYHLLKKHVLGSEGGWDYMALDGKTRLLYVTHGGAVEILNVDTGVNLEGEPASRFPLPTVASLPASLSRAGHGPAPCDQGGIPPWIPRRAVPRGKPRGIFPLVKKYERKFTTGKRSSIRKDYLSRFLSRIYHVSPRRGSNSSLRPFP
jgi:hypothetical protein